MFNIAAALSLLLCVAATAAWVMSHAGPPRWRLIATAHSADLTRANSEPNAALFTPTANWSKAPNYGFWDAWWALSQSGRLTLLAQVIDYEGTLRQVHASPPSLTVHLPGPSNAHATVFGGMPSSGAWASRLGFAWHSDAQQVGGVGARAWMVTLPWWFVVLLALPMPALWLRAVQRR